MIGVRDRSLDLTVSELELELSLSLLDTLDGLDTELSLALSSLDCEESDDSDVSNLFISSRSLERLSDISLDSLVFPW